MPLLHVERLPLALKRRLESKAERAFEILYYKSDHERKTVSELISDLGNGDLMLAFISGKYLRSEYCMAELLACAQYYQPEMTFEQPGTWLDHLWLVPIEPGLRSFLSGQSESDLEGKTDTADLAAVREYHLRRQGKICTPSF